MIENVSTETIQLNPGLSIIISRHPLRQFLARGALLCASSQWLLDDEGNHLWGKIYIDIPDEQERVDNLVVLYALLHEMAHYRQLFSRGVREIYLLASLTRQQGSSGPLEIAANKYAFRMLTRLGVSPSAICQRLAKAGLRELIPAGFQGKPYALVHYGVLKISKKFREGVPQFALRTDMSFKVIKGV